MVGMMGLMVFGGMRMMNHGDKDHKEHAQTELKDKPTKDENHKHENEK